MCRNDELSSTMSWVGCLLKDSELFILFAENSQILLKISVIPILLTFIYLVALNLLVNNYRPTQLIIVAHNCHALVKKRFNTLCAKIHLLGLHLSHPVPLFSPFFVHNGAKKILMPQSLTYIQLKLRNFNFRA